MSTFYLLPDRLSVGRQYAKFLSSWFPGLIAPAHELADHLASAAQRPGVFVLFADDLPDADAPTAALAASFGIDATDRVVDLRPAWEAARAA